MARTEFAEITKPTKFEYVSDENGGGCGGSDDSSSFATQIKEQILINIYIRLVNDDRVAGRRERRD